MKKFISPILIFLCGFLFLGGSALAITVNGEDVGYIDPVYAYDTVHPPSEANETDWIQSVLGEEYYISGEYSVSGADWYQTSEDDVYAFDLGGTPDYFYIFLASSPETLYNAWLYQNLAELAWAVVDISEWEGIYIPPGGEINIGRVSHMRNIVGVPEPTTGLLLGAALLGMGMISRKKLLK